MSPGPYDALLLVSFGGPEGPQDVLPFLQNVTRGRGVPPERLAEVANHYQAFGGRSPINDQNRALLAALGPELARAGFELPLYWGNRNWHPFLADTVAEMTAAGIRRALAFVTSATSSYSSCRQYLEDLEAARAAVAAQGGAPPSIDKLRPFFNHPGFIRAQADAVRVALDSLADPAARGRARLVFCAHSIPTGQAATCDYEAQLREASRLVVEALGEPGRAWGLAWQSRSGPPQVPWLAPDISDELATLAAQGVDTVVLVPIGFVSEHLEVVYDLDTVALARAAELGITARRAAAVGTHPRFVSMVVELVGEAVAGAAPLAIGRLAARPARCAAGCCPPPARPAGRPPS